MDNHPVLQTVHVEYKFEDYKASCRYTYFKSDSTKWYDLIAFILGVIIFFSFLWIIPESAVEASKILRFFDGSAPILWTLSSVHLVFAVFPFESDFLKDKKVFDLQLCEEFIVVSEGGDYIKSVVRNPYGDYQKAFESEKGFFFAGKRNGTLYIPKSALMPEQITWLSEFLAGKFGEGFKQKTGGAG